MNGVFMSYADKYKIKANRSYNSKIYRFKINRLQIIAESAECILVQLQNQADSYICSVWFNKKWCKADDFALMVSVGITDDWEYVIYEGIWNNKEPKELMKLKDKEFIMFLKDCGIEVK